eukprot:1483711-Pleurochrysis_carterae.AAC.2
MFIARNLLRSANPEVPAEVQAAVDAGDAESVQRLLTPLPDGWSKTFQKKLVKQAEINAKKASKGSGAPKQSASAPKATSQGGSEAASSTTAVKAPGGAAAGSAASAPTGPTGIAEQALVADVLECLRSLAIPAEALQALQGQEALLCQAIAPRLNAIRNQSYALGFCSQAARP